MTRLLLATILIVVPHSAFSQGVAWESLPHQSTVPFSARVSFSRLAKGALTDQDEGAKELGNTPGIAPVLMELFEKVYSESNDFQHVFTVLHVLTLRGDLAENELGILRKKLEEVWNQPGDSKSVALKDKGLRIIANYPGEANETLLLKYLTEPKSLEVVGFPRNAVEGLKGIGTERSLEALQAYRSEQTEGSGRYKAATAAIEAITAREKQTTSPEDDGLITAGRGNTTSQRSLETVPNGEGNEEKLGATGRGAGWAIAGIAVLVGVAVALAARRKSIPRGSQ